MKPGITGWAQINHKYGDTEVDAMIKLEYDLYYIKHMVRTRCVHHFPHHQSHAVEPRRAVGTSAFTA